MKLSRREIRFVCEYLIDRDPSAAAIRAGYSGRRSETVGRDLLARPEVERLIKELESEQRKKQEMTPEKMRSLLVQTGETALKAGQYGAAIRACVILSRCEREQTAVDGNATTADAAFWSQLAHVLEHEHQALREFLTDRGFHLSENPTPARMLEILAAQRKAEVFARVRQGYEALGIRSVQPTLEEAAKKAKGYYAPLEIVRRNTAVLKDVMWRRGIEIGSDRRGGDQ